MQHDLFGPVMYLMLALASYDADDIFNGTVAFLAPDNDNKMQSDMTCWTCDATGTSVALHDTYGMNGNIAFVR